MARDNKYRINSGEIYEHEYLNWNSGDTHHDLIRDMELNILSLLKKNNLCGKSEETGHHELYKEKEKEFEQNLVNLTDERFRPFTYFYLSKRKSESGEINWMICDYGITCIINRDEENQGIFEY